MNPNMNCKFGLLLFLLKNKGIRYAYNRIHFYIFWHWIRKHPFLIKLLNLLAPYPSYIEIEVTTRCNMKCVMCEHSYWDEPNRDMSFEEFKKIVDQFPRLKWIGLTGIGESFINKDFMKMLKYVKSKDVFVELYDTFFFINEKIAEELIDIGIDKIFASIDAATKETYERIRIGSSFEKVINNVWNLFQLKKEKKSYWPEVDFHYIVNKANLSEIPQYIELVHSLTKGENTIVRFTRMLHRFKEVEDLFIEIPQEIIEIAKKKAKELRIVLSWNADVPRLKPSISRCIEWTMPFIFVTGHVLPCCSGHEAGQRDFQKETALGNVFEQSFKKIWRKEEYRNLRKMLRQGKAILPCRNCCLYEVKECEF